MPKTVIAIAATALTLFAAPAAHAKSAAANTAGCTAQPAFDHPFTAFGDSATYTLSPGGDMESGLAGWKLTGGAAVVDGDDGLGVRPGAKVLRLPAGATATSAPICIDDTFPHAKILARNLQARVGRLDVQVLYVDINGRPVSKGTGSYMTNHHRWALSGELAINALLDGAAPISFRFSAPPNTGWLLDDFYVDPRARG